MKSRKASMIIKRKVHHEYLLPVIVYGSGPWALKKAHMVLSVAQRKIERHLGPAWPIIARDRRLWKQLRLGYLLTEWKKPWCKWQKKIISQVYLQGTLNLATSWYQMSTTGPRSEFTVYFTVWLVLVWHMDRHENGMVLILLENSRWSHSRPWHITVNYS